ncbi:PSD1 and planctomycete cytochrome C domain-containing protein [Gemmata sp.]|uniref:PSD1 and planctomycete cytochrome C domain-containing protein n=1 Tax=Gemmata sp. TaxID=1914242 RepID=UPI003F720ADE
MWFPRLRLLAAAVVFWAAPDPARAADPNPPPTKEQVVFFEKKIRPVLVKNCFECHSGSTQAPGGLRLDTPEGIRIGGTRGALIDSKSPEASLLLKALRPEGGFRPGRGARQMPPAGPLTDDEIADIAAWVKMGAPDPRVTPPVKVPGKKIDFAKARAEGWAYQPVKEPAVPDAGKGWAWSPVDNFVAATQAKTGTKPVADADPLVWLRRVSLDLVGLPPSLEHIAALKGDASRAAREKIVDELLASKAFGERWGRHWLDIARYAESTGKERNFIYPQAWRYRDWVIDAFNADKPYNRFLAEQIAGDLLPAETPAERDANTVATGFLALGPKGINDRNRVSFLMEIANEQIENIGRGVLALSVGCARCHEHKFDPIAMSDYYALAGIFRSTDTRAGVQNRQFQAGRAELLVPLSNAKAAAADPKLEAEIAAALKDVAATREALAKLRGVPAGGPPGAPVPAANPAVPETPEVVAAQEAFTRANTHLANLRAKEALPQVFTHAVALADREDPSDTPLRHRGEVDQLGPVVPRGFPKVIAVADPPVFDTKESGRRQLADWLTRPDHPLTSRVFVNRVWSKLFGAGIVPTLDDFGDQGQRPTHPELLDFLSSRFVAQGWSVKKTVRELVLSRTYQLGSGADAANTAKDETNVSLWRFTRRRLDAEVNLLSCDSA